MNDSDFIGFSFNGVHSDTLHIKRVSDGSRYNDTLSPNFQDVKAQVPGRDGTLYWDSFYSEKPFPVQIAFDDLSEVGLRTLKQTFNGKAEGWLIFDEEPYKQWWVKIQNSPQIKYLCFYDENNNRVYKGEGTINFVAYDVYAHGVKHFNSEFTSPNKSEWIAAAGMPASPSRDVVQTSTPPSYDLSTSTSHPYPVAFVNAGDREMDWIVSIPITNPSIRSIVLTKASDPSNNIIGQLVFDSITIPSGYNDNYLIIDSSTELVQGCNRVGYNTRRKYGFHYTLTGSLYNKYISSGSFFKIPVSTRDSEGNIEDDYLFYALSTTDFTTDTSYLVLEPTTPTDIMPTSVFYDYIYY